MINRLHFCSWHLAAFICTWRHISAQFWQCVSWNLAHSAAQASQIVAHRLQNCWL